MPQASAGLLMFRHRTAGVQVLLVHPGGPFWRNRDVGAWTIPKGEPAAGEDLVGAARREFEEETGVRPPATVVPLGHVKQRGGKFVHAWAAEGDLDAAAVRSNTFEVEWPPRSGRRATFPEVDRAEWFDVSAAAEKINPAQAEFLDRLRAILGRGE